MNKFKRLAFFSALLVTLLCPINQRSVVAKAESNQNQFHMYSTESSVKKTLSPVTLYVDYDNDSNECTATVTCPTTQTKSGTQYTYNFTKCVLYLNGKKVTGASNITKDEEEFVVEFSDIQLKKGKKNTIKATCTVTQTNEKGKSSKLTKSPSVSITASNNDTSSSAASGIKSYEVIYEDDYANNNTCVGVVIQAKGISISIDDVRSKYKNATITETASGSYTKYKISNLVVNKKTKDSVGNLVIKYRLINSGESNTGTVYSLEIPYSVTSINKKSGDIMSLKRSHFTYPISLTINNAIDYENPVAIIETSNELSSFYITVNKKNKQVVSDGLIPSGKKTITSDSIAIPNLKTGDVVELTFEMQGVTYSFNLTIPEGFINQRYSFGNNSYLVYNTLLQKGKVIVYVNENGTTVEEKGTFSLVKAK